MRRLAMEAGDLLGHFVDMRSRQFAIGLQGAQQLALWELAHFQNVFQRRAFAAQNRRFSGAGNRQYLKVQAFCQPLVQT